MPPQDRQYRQPYLEKIWEDCRTSNIGWCAVCGYISDNAQKDLKLFVLEKKGDDKPKLGYLCNKCEFKANMNSHRTPDGREIHRAHLDETGLVSNGRFFSDDEYDIAVPSRSVAYGLIQTLHIASDQRSPK